MIAKSVSERIRALIFKAKKNEMKHYERMLLVRDLLIEAQGLMIHASVSSEVIALSTNVISARYIADSLVNSDVAKEK